MSGPADIDTFKDAQENSGQSRYTGPKLVFRKGGLIRESELQDYRITSLTKCPLLISGKLNTDLGYLYHWILYVGHFQLSPDPDVDKDPKPG